MHEHRSTKFVLEQMVRAWRSRGDLGVLELVRRSGGAMKLVQGVQVEMGAAATYLPTCKPTDHW